MFYLFVNHYLSDSATHTAKTKCIKCTRAINKRIREHEKATGDVVTVDQYSNFSTRHDGVCYRVNPWNANSAEEFQSEKAARDLLLDKDGQYLGDDEAIFCREIAADNDTRSPKRAIQMQRDIIGDVVNGVAEHNPDSGHVIKDTNNDLFATRGKDKSFNSTACLTNLRIKSIHTDLRDPIMEYHEKLDDVTARQNCLTQLNAIITHHCGDHSKCKFKKYCTYLQVKNANPNWPEDKVRAKTAKKCKRHGGQTMDLSRKGIATLEKIISKRFNENTIDRIAK